MKLFQMIATILALSMTALLLACSSGSSTPPPPPAISVSLSSPPPGNMTVNTGASVTATVSNDSANAGVTWSCAPSGSCGSFNPTSTASGTATTYTAPATVPSGNVTVTATSVTDGTKSASATITIAPVPIADGSYVFSVTGTDATGSPYFVAGQFVVSGGAITGGEQDFTDFTFAQTDLINSTGNLLTTTADGNMQIQLTTCNHTNCATPDTAVGVGGIETFNGTLVSATRARIVEFDAFATSSGTLDLQDSTAAATSPSGGYAFMSQGVNFSGGPLAIGGVLQLDGSGGITATGSVFDVENAGAPFANESINSTGSSVTGPDASGRVVITVNPTSTSLHPFSTAGYIVDSTHVQLVEIIDPTGGTTGGVALGQNPANLAVSGNSYVVGLNGFDASGPIQIAGLLNLTSGATTVGGTLSYNEFNVTTAAGTISGGNYVADSNGRVTLTGVTDGVATFNIQLYVDGNGNALTITLDSTADVDAGIGYQQTGGGSFTAASFTGTYVMGTTGWDNNFFEFDSVGPITADGVSALGSGLVDLNWISGSSGTVSLPTANLPVSGTFTAAADGVFTPGTITGLDVVAPTNADAFTYYLADPTKAIAIEVDTNQWALGYLEVQ